MRRRALLLAAVAGGAALFALQAGPAAAGFVGAGAGPDRCAQASGNVPGGTAQVEVCTIAGGGVFGPVPGIPFTDAGVDTDACVRVTTALRGTHIGCGVVAPTALVMDPVMHQAVMKFSLAVSGGTFTVNVTLNGSGVPVPGRSVGFVAFGDASPELLAAASAWAWLDRAATVATGSSISSSKAGGGALSAARGSMDQSAGAFAFAFLP